MGCNCGKPAQNFKNLVQQASNMQPVSQAQSNLPNPVPHIGRAERIRLRVEKMARRSAGIESRRIAREARIKARQEASLKTQGK